jgi:hypothetical protein
MRAVSAWAVRALYFGIGFDLLSALLTHEVAPPVPSRYAARAIASISTSWSG